MRQWTENLHHLSSRGPTCRDSPIADHRRTDLTSSGHHQSRQQRGKKWPLNSEHMLTGAGPPAPRVPRHDIFFSTQKFGSFDRSATDRYIRSRPPPDSARCPAAAETVSQLSPSGHASLPCRGHSQLAPVCIASRGDVVLPLERGGGTRKIAAQHGSTADFVFFSENQLLDRWIPCGSRLVAVPFLLAY